MIAGCPTCAARYRIDTAKLRPEGSRLRCSRCETVFRVQPPPARAPSAPVSEREPAAPPPLARRAAAPAAGASREVAPDPARLVLIAHPELRAGKAIADAIGRWGVSTLLAQDGVEAILQVQRLLPRVVVLDAALPKMFGFQVCELMKRNEQLRSIPVVLVGAIHDEHRYRRPPGELYGADAYVERQQLPEALAGLFARFGLALEHTPHRSAPRPVAAAPAAPRSAPVPAALRPPASVPRAPSAPAADPERDQAERLARIIVSDVILYNQEKFDAALREGNVVEALADELAEGYALFAQRVDTSRCDPREMLQRELLRVARSRGMR